MEEYEAPKPPSEPPPIKSLTQVCNTQSEEKYNHTPSICDTSVSSSDSHHGGWNIPTDVNYYTDDDVDDDMLKDAPQESISFTDKITNTVKAVINNLFTLASTSNLRPNPIIDLPNNNVCFDQYIHSDDNNDSLESLKHNHGFDLNNLTVQGYDFEQNQRIQKDKLWTHNWYGSTEQEQEKVLMKSQIFTTETICEQAIQDLNNMLDNSDFDYDMEHLNHMMDDPDQTDGYDADMDTNLSSNYDPEETINDIIDTITYNSEPTKTMTKRDLVKIYDNGVSKNIVMKIRKEDLEADPKMMDSGANRNITNKREILRRYKKLRHRIPVSGVASGGPACYIEGYGYVDLLTEEGHNIETIVYYSPHCSSTILSPNAIVAESKGRFTG